MTVKVSETFILPEPILSDLASSVLEFHFQDFSESIPYVWAHADLYLSTYRQTEKRKEFLNKLVMTDLILEK